jgi:hypothetical protein
MGLADNAVGFRIAGQNLFRHQFAENMPIIPGGRAWAEQPESGPLTRRPGFNYLIEKFLKLPLQ